MARVVAFFIFFCCLVLSKAQHEPGQCIFYEECGRNPTLNGTLITPIVPCLDYSPARRLTPQHYKQLKQVCPMLDQGENNTYACCSIPQLLSLEKSLSLSQTILNRCPSCSNNFAHLHCITTCSPDQSLYLNVTRTMNITYQGKTREAVVGYQAYLNTRFAEGSFQSCKNVRIPATGGFAISTMCGRYGAKLCTAQRWYDFQGDSSNGLAPLDIDFHLLHDDAVGSLPDGIVAYNGTALKCNEKIPTGGEVCSCQDCEESCPVVPGPPEPPGPFKILGVNGYLLICFILFCILVLSFLIYLLVSCCVSINTPKKIKKT